mgnify:CR=1 FL=1
MCVVAHMSMHFVVQSSNVHACIVSVHKVHSMCGILLIVSQDTSGGVFKTHPPTPTVQHWEKRVFQFFSVERHAQTQRVFLSLRLTEHRPIVTPC